MQRLPSTTDLQLLWRTLTASYASNPYEARQEYMTRVILVFMVTSLSIFTLPILAGWLLGLFALEDFFIMLLLTSSAVASLWWAQRGHWRWSSYYPPLLCFLLAVYLNSLGGLATTGILFYALSILLTGMLHSVRSQWYLIGLCLVVYLVVGWLHGDRALDYLTSAGLTVSGGFVALALLQWFFTSQLKAALAEARTNAAELQAYRDRLEALVQERTAALRATNQELEREIAERQRAEVALQRAHDELETRVQERTSELSTMLETARAVASALDLQQLLDTIAELMAQAVIASCCKIFRVDAPSASLVPWTRWPLAETPQPDFSWDEDESEILSSVLQSGRPCIVQSADPQMDPAEVDWLREIGVPGALVLPLSTRDQVIGLIVLHKDTAGPPFDASDIRLCQALADQTAVAVERRRVETALRESEAKYRQLVQHAPAGIYEINLVNPRFLSVNDVMCEYTGYSREEFLALNPLDILTKESKQQFYRRISQLQSGQPVTASTEYTIQGKNERVFNVLLNTSFVYQDGRPAKATVIAHDITDRTRAEQALRESESRYRALFETSPESITVIDLQGIILDCNPATEKLSGLSRQELVGRSFTDIGVLEDQDIQKSLEILSSLPRDGISALEFQIRGPDNERCWLEIFPSLLEKEGQVYAVQIISRDMTAHVRAAQQLKERQRYLEQVLAAAPDAIVTTDPHHRVVEWNLGAEKLFGYTLERVIGRNLDDFITNQEVWEEATSFTRRAQAGQEVGPVVTVRYRQDGTPVNVILAGSPILVEDELIGMVAVYTDITERVQAEKEIQRRNRELALLNQVITATTSTLDLEQILQIACRELARVFDLSQVAAALVDEDQKEITVIAEHIPADFPGAVGMSIPVLGNVAAEQILAHKAPLIVDDVRGDPRLKPVHNLLSERQIVTLMALPVFNRDMVTGLIGMATDRHRAFDQEEVALAQNVAAAVSQALETARLYQALQNRTDELARALAQQRELERLKHQFIQNVSHELRTPLAIARGYAELLEDGTLGLLQPEQQEPVAIIARRMRMLTDLMDDVNAILEAEIQEFERKAIDLSNLVYATLADFQVVAKEREIRLSSQVVSDSLTMRGDPTQIRRVLDNLIGNALKFTPAGGRITVRLQHSEDMALVEVADTGVGIPPDQLDRVFERFYQVDGSMSRRYGGTGLGLALVKEIVEAHGGGVALESKLDVGSNFFVRLPLADESAG